MSGTLPGYHRLSRLLHWLIVVLTMVVFGVTYVWDNANHDTYEAVHKSVGITIFVLMLIRLAQWLFIPHPRPLPGPPWRHAAARISHLLLYAAFLVQPILGILDSMAGGYPINFYFIGNLPALLAPNKALSDWCYDLHVHLPPYILALLSIHIAAALYHHAVLKDGTLKRMSTD